MTLSCIYFQTFVAVPLISLFVVLNLSTIEASTLPCISGTEQEKRALYNKVIAEESILRYHDSFYSVGQCMFNEANRLLDDQEDSVAKRNLERLGLRNVPAIHTNPNTPCPRHSAQGPLCTSIEVPMMDIDRYPRHLTTVQCTCGSCGSGEPGVLTHRCQGVNYYVRVLRRKRGPSRCPSGKQSWQKSIERVNLACVCLNIIQSE